MKKILFVICFGAMLSLSAKTVEELVKELQDRNSGVKTETTATSAENESKSSSKSKKKNEQDAETVVQGFPGFAGFTDSGVVTGEQSKDKDKDKDKEKKKRQKNLQPIKSIDERFREATSQSLSKTLTSATETTTGTSVSDTIHQTFSTEEEKKKTQFKQLSERFEEATKRYAGYDSHAKSELASGAKVATVPKKEKPNSDHLTPIGSIPFGADYNTLRGLKGTKEPGVYQLNLTSQYFIFSILKVYVNADAKVSKITANKEYATLEQAKAQYATLLLRIQQMYSLKPTETETESGKTNVFNFIGGDKITIELDSSSARPSIHLTAQSATY